MESNQPQLSDTTALWETRLLVFLETSPQSGRYHQILLTGEQYKKVSDAVILEVESNHDGVQGVRVSLSSETYPLPDLRSICYNKGNEA